ncbi:MAG: hypothetical protein KatS3mg082_0607 [Nitrospiraceae bacterium]|nr:MAG: hypothetical protein KatS3mg082_0607 [Nitrospiraceae bacterium]
MKDHGHLRNIGRHVVFLRFTLHASRFAVFVAFRYRESGATVARLPRFAAGSRQRTASR